MWFYPDSETPSTTCSHLLVERWGAVQEYSVASHHRIHNPPGIGDRCTNSHLPPCLPRSRLVGWGGSFAGFAGLAFVAGFGIGAAAFLLLGGALGTALGERGLPGCSELTASC